MSYLFWTLACVSWMTIGVIMLKYVWKDTHGGLAMVAHDVPVFGVLLLIAVIVFWPYPRLLVYLFVLLPMELWEKTDSWRRKFRSFMKTGKWPKPVKKEDPKRTNFDKVAPSRLSDEETEALMICIERYVTWVKHNPNPADFRYADIVHQSADSYNACRAVIAKRLSECVQNPQQALSEVSRDQLKGYPDPKLWHRGQ